MKCEYCNGSHGKAIKITASPFRKETQPNEIQIFQAKDMATGMVLFKQGLAQGFFDIKYCPMCGKEVVSDSKQREGCQKDCVYLGKPTYKSPCNMCVKTNYKYYVGSTMEVKE